MMRAEMKYAHACQFKVQPGIYRVMSSSEGRARERRPKPRGQNSVPRQGSTRGPAPLARLSHQKRNMLIV